MGFFLVKDQDSENCYSEDINPKTENEEHTDPGDEYNDQFMTRSLCALFIVPVVMIALGNFFGYIHHFLFTKARNLISMVDNYMLSVDQIDMDQTPVKVLERLDAETTFLYSDSDLEWDDSIERNAEQIVDEIYNEMDTSLTPGERNASASNHFTSTSIISINLDDYMNAINFCHVIEKNTSQKDNKEDQCQNNAKSSTPKPLDLRSSSSASKGAENDLNRFLSKSDHFPSFNATFSDSDHNELDKNLDQSDVNINMEINYNPNLKQMDNAESRTRSGKRYK